MNNEIIDTGFRRQDKCPECGYILNAATCPDDLKAIPESGDISICFNCYECLKFSDDLSLVKCDVTTLPIESARQISNMQYGLKKVKEKP